MQLYIQLLNSGEKHKGSEQIQFTYKQAPKKSSNSILKSMLIF